MRKYLFVSLIVGTWLNAASAEPAKPLVLIESARSFSENTFPRQGSWLGLYCKGADCELRDAAVMIRSATTRNNVLEEDEMIDVIKVADAPFALFHGVPLRPGKVLTWFKADKSGGEGRHISQLEKLGQWRMPGGATPLSLSWVKLPEEGGFRYHLSDGKTKQFLFATSLQSHYGGSTTPYVHWVGDLDKDGKTDFLLDLPDDNCSYDDRLYLSSLATGPSLVGKAAQLAGREAACGC